MEGGHLQAPDSGAAIGRSAERAQANRGVDNFGLGRLQHVDPRAVWKNEAHDLTPWLLENLDVLGVALGTEIIPSQREAQVGDFKLDILGEDSAGRPVIIENQLEPTDHGHLGQLLVYASGLEAAVVVWVTPRFRDEHRRALDWLNERTDDNVHFFGVELDLVKIGDSPPAPTFRISAEPNDWQKAIKAQTGVSDTARVRHDFFTQVVSKIADARADFRPPKIGFSSWISMSSGPFGFYAVSFTIGNRLRAEVYLDTGDQATTKQLFDSCFRDREALEHAFGEPITWERLDDKRASRIAVYRAAPDSSIAGDNQAAQDWAAKRAVRFMEVFDDRLRREWSELGREAG
jgi:hypothetical protein